MPIYDLFCVQCGFCEEFFSQRIVIDTGRACPTCAIALVKKVVPIQAIFKGPGFYATEHGRSQFNYKADKKNEQERDEFIENARKGAGV